MDQFRAELEVLGIRMTERRQSELYPVGTYNAAIRRAMDERERVFDTLAEQQTAGRHETSVEQRRRAYYPFKPYCTDVLARRHARALVGRHGRRMGMPARPRGFDVVGRRRADQRQARVEGRLADALGARGRLVRARRRGPPRADRELHGRAHARRRPVRRPRAGVDRLLVRDAGGGRRQDVGLGRRRRGRIDRVRGDRARDRPLALRPPAALAVVCDRPVAQGRTAPLRRVGPARGRRARRRIPTRPTSPSTGRAPSPPPGRSSARSGRSRSGCWHRSPTSPRAT